MGAAVAKHGVVVRQVEPNAPAGRAGVKVGDIITALNGDRIDNWNTFVHDVVSKKIGETIRLTVIRDGTSHTLSVTLADRPAEPR